MDTAAIRVAMRWDCLKEKESSDASLVHGTKGNGVVDLGMDRLVINEMTNAYSTAV